jgi:hypothetical protein
MTVTTLHLLNNLARADNCKFQTQGHFDGALNWCNRDFAFLNSMGAHYNPVSISIVNSESKTSLEWSYNTNTVRLCGNETCGFCTQIKYTQESPCLSERNQIVFPSGEAFK